MYQILLSALLGMVGKILTAEFIEFAIVRFAEILAKRTATTYDDEFVAKIKELLGKK